MVSSRVRWRSIKYNRKLDLHEFKRIVVNVQQKIELDYCMKRVTLGESKHNERHEDRYKIDSNTQQTPRFSTLKNYKEQNRAYNWANQKRT